jgi:hypothetical protein
MSKAGREAKKAQQAHDRYLASLQPSRPKRPGLWATMPPKVKVALVLGLVLSWPVAQGWNAGTISTSSAAIRVAVALVVAYVGVQLVAAVVTGYLPKPEPEPDPDAEPTEDGVEDAVLVEPEAAEAEG